MSMTSSILPKITVLGAGPAGLGTGYYARKQGLPYHLYEAASTVGGNCQTLTMGPFRFDTGAHRLHDKVPAVTAEIKKLLGNDLRRIHVPSQIFWDGTFIDFPLSPFDLVTKLAPKTLLTIVWENLRLQLGQQQGAFNNFREMALQAYGPTLSEMFLLNYSEKLWGQPTEELSPQIAGGRLNGLDLKTFLLEAVAGKRKKTRHLDGSFYYPKYGFGTIFEAMADAVGQKSITCDARVTEIKHNGRHIDSVTINDRTSVGVDEVVSTLPLSVTMNLLRPAPPPKLLKQINSVSFRHLRLLVLGVDTPRLSPNASIYFPDRKHPFTRIYEPKNRSEAMAPAGQTALVIEFPTQFESRHWQISAETLQKETKGCLAELGLVDPSKINSYKAYRLPFAYPVLDQSIETRVQPVIDYLKSFNNLNLLGRSAQFQYSHTHDLLAAAQKTVAQIGSQVARQF